MSSQHMMREGALGAQECLGLGGISGLSRVGTRQE